MISPSPASSKSTGIKAGYWPSSSSWIFPASAIDTSYFTHIYYAFVTLDPTTYTLAITQPDETMLPNFTTTLHAKNPPAKALLSIGGAGAGATIFSNMVRTASTRRVFINSTIYAARKYNLDGFDIDWEFPTTQQDMDNLVLLLAEWHITIKKEARFAGKPQLLLTAAVYFSAEFFLSGNLSYPGVAMWKKLSWVNAMCYDYHGSWDPSQTGAHAALFDPNSNISTSYGIQSWIKLGVPRHKIVMGLPLYGRTWQLEDPGVHGIGAPAVSVGPGDNGVMIYSDVVDFNLANNATVYYDKDTVSTYSYAGTAWIGYDDPMSVYYKMKYARDKRIGGYFFWAVGFDKNWTVSKQAAIAWELWGNSH
ncbi:class V chitinase CHIT5-like [Tasmannia lanceolata]|uniref:class V chitinase CHIT5-like n=1 Tax=Tasmannia lanceolata TaxID=3420 RepID=UPI004064030B